MFRALLILVGSLVGQDVPDGFVDPKIREDAPADVKALFAEMRERRLQKIGELDEMIQRETAALKKAKQSKLKKSLKDKEISSHGDRVARAKRERDIVLTTFVDSPVYPSDGGAELKVGKLFRFPDTLRVLQVLGPDKALLEVQFQTRNPRFNAAGQINGFDVENHSFPVMGKVPTNGLTDNRGVQFDFALRVSGTETYRTASGASKTVLLLERFDASQFLDKP